MIKRWVRGDLAVDKIMTDTLEVRTCNYVPKTTNWYTKLKANLEILNLEGATCRSAIWITISSSKPSLMLSISVQNYICLLDQVSGSNKSGPMKAAFTRLLHQFITYRGRLKGGPQVWWNLFLLLLITSAWPCLQNSWNLGPVFRSVGVLKSDLCSIRRSTKHLDGSVHTLTPFAIFSSYFSPMV